MNLLGPGFRRFLVTAATVTRNWKWLGPSGIEFLVTTAVVTRNLNPPGPTLPQFMVNAAAETWNGANAFWKPVGEYSCGQISVSIRPQVFADMYLYTLVFVQ